MANPHEKDARRSMGDKLSALAGSRGEYPNDRASRIAGVKVNAAAQGDSGGVEEAWVAAPARQISNYGKVRK